MKKSILLSVGIITPILSFANVLINSDFENGTMDNWVPKMSNECWEVDSSTALEGAKNLKALDLNIADNIYVYTNVTFDLSNYNYAWQFMMDSLEPTSGNKYWFWLAADKNDFNATDIKGYLVGVQYDSSNDNLSLWKVNGTSDVTKIIESSFDVGSVAFAVKVTRSSDGLWVLYYNNDNSFDIMTLGGTATDTSFATLSSAGPYFLSTSSNSGNFRFDALTISRNQGISAPTITSSAGTNVSVYVDENVNFDITASVGATSFGGLFSTNKPNESTFIEHINDFPLLSSFIWTPSTIGSYSAVFTSTNETGATTLTVNIEVDEQPDNELWINEFHYDGINEGVEIAGIAGINLSNYKLYLYRDSGTVYDTNVLSGAIPNENNTGYGAVWFAVPAIQNGPADGFALVKIETEDVLYLLSYEGTLTATEGPADGMTSVDVGVSELSSTPDDYSLQLKGSGSYYEDFTWTAPSLYSHGLINDEQTITSPTDHGALFMIK